MTVEPIPQSVLDHLRDSGHIRGPLHPWADDSVARGQAMAQQERSVLDALEGLDKRLSLLMEHVGEMTSRLAPALRPDVPRDGGAKAGTISCRSPLAERVASASHHVGEITGMIQRVMGRLDL